MKWLILAICAEVGVLLCLIFSFDDALHSMQSARLTWDHGAVAITYVYLRAAFSKKRIARQSSQPARVPVP
jgi:hypothetical protein